MWYARWSRRTREQFALSQKARTKARNLLLRFRARSNILQHIQIVQKMESRIEKIRKPIAYSALAAGILSGLSAFMLSAFMMITERVGLCEWWDSDCTLHYEYLGGIIFSAFFLFFVVGILFFVLSKTGRKTARNITLFMVCFGLFLYLVPLPDDDGFGFVTTAEIIGWPVAVLYGVYMLTLTLHELLSGKVSIFGRYARFKLFTVILFMFFLVLYLVERLI